MDKDLKILGGHPMVVLDDAIEYISQRAGKDCPACGYSKWTVYASGESRKTPGVRYAVGLVGVDLATGSTLPNGVPFITVTCKKCSFARLHNLERISKWIEAGKPEFAEDE
jgi:predicted nucleic-acid-binding Zn-ribbon protein